MSSKMGRPKTDNPKSNDVKVRMYDKTHEKLLEYCKLHGITKAEAIRQGIHLLLQKNKLQVTAGNVTTYSLSNPTRKTLSEIYYNSEMFPCQVKIKT